MTARLLRDQIAHHLAVLQQRSTLTALQSARLTSILDTLADDGRFLLRAALDVAEFPAGDNGGGVARVWDAATAEPLHELTGHTDWVRVVAWSPDGTRLLTSSYDSTVRVWDATSGLPVGFTIVTLPGAELAVFDTIADQLVRASAGAWRWLGWNIVEDGRLTRLPAESFGPLPPLHPADRSAESA